MPIKQLPNTLSILRVLLSISLFTLKPLGLAFFIAYSLAGITDILDGFIARKTNSESLFGAKLDSIADMVMVCVLMIILLPIIDFKTYHIVWIIIIALIRVISLISTYIKFRQFTLIHSFLNKLTGLFLLSTPFLLLFPNYDRVINTACVIASFSAIEEFLIIIFKKEYNPDIKSIFSGI